MRKRRLDLDNRIVDTITQWVIDKKLESAIPPRELAKQIAKKL